MKTVETRHGCLDAVKCGDTCKTCQALRSLHNPQHPQYVGHEYVPQGQHVCGAVDACVDVKTNGEVCTFGTMTSVTFHDDTDIEAEALAIEDMVADAMVHDGASSSKAAARAAMSAFEKAKIRAEVRKGKNIHTPQAEADSRASGKKHGDDNRAFHDSNRTVFGH